MNDATASDPQAHVSEILRVLCGEIGVRPAGTSAERRAAEYVCDQLRCCGVDPCEFEEFACTSVRSANAIVQALPGAGKPLTAEADVLTGSNSTVPHGKMLEFELAWLEMPEQASRLKSGAYLGQAVVIVGSLAEQGRHYQALIRSGASLVIWADDRLPFGWTKSDGMIPAWTRKYGGVPMVGIAYRTAYEWRLRGVSRIRARVDSRLEKGVSQNVVGTLHGRSDDETIIVGCHHDTQRRTVGADDNASGVATLLLIAQSLARMVKQRGKRLRRTVRFVSFGCEEQLSVGARRYCEQHRSDMKRCRLMVNIDSIGSPMGHTQLLAGGSDALAAWGCRWMEKSDIRVRLSREVFPFADHFPFTALGVPALWLYRPNCAGGRWQHHSVYDTPEQVSAEMIAQLGGALAALVAEAANRSTLPFRRGVSKSEFAEIRRMAKDMFAMQV